MEEICPRCAKRDIEPNSWTGWCGDCTIENLRERYGGKQRKPTLGRRDAGLETAQSSWDRDRQRASRLRRHVKPKELADPNADPWELANEALRELATVRTIFRARRARPAQYERLDLIAETLRRLAWGPDKPEDVVEEEKSRRASDGGKAASEGRLSSIPS